MHARVGVCTSVCVCTFLAVGPSDLDGGQVVEKFLELWVAETRPPGVVGLVMEPERGRDTHTHTV